MHACGPDSHTAILLVAAKILVELKEQIKGTVKLIFQPAEELIQGAKKMLEDRILHEKFNIDEDALPVYASLYAQFALDFLNQ